jgi:hypothetical protein
MIMAAGEGWKVARVMTYRQPAPSVLSSIDKASITHGAQAVFHQRYKHYKYYGYAGTATSGHRQCNVSCRPALWTDTATLSLCTSALGLSITVGLSCCFSNRLQQAVPATVRCGIPFATSQLRATYL